MTAHRVRTGDGIELHVIDEGRGRPLLFVPGFAQAASCFARQAADLSDGFRVVRADPRGHGSSAKPGHGYRVGRMAADLDDVVRTLGLDDIVLVAHSMGCAIAWAYLEQIPSAPVSALVIVDRPPVLTGPAGSGAIFGTDEVYALAAALRSPTGRDVLAGFIRGMFSPGVPESDIAALIEDSLRLPPDLAAELYLNTRFGSWEDFLPRVSVPTLVISGEASTIPVEAMKHTAELVPGARLEVFGAAEGGSHFMFWENPARFNRLIRDFAGLKGPF